jgi:wyosine [tRNA(Phe)-imidazoG37] synthetase (radical SAM superfamily)
MAGDETRACTAPRYRIERAHRGYRVLGPDILIWEPTLGEAQERREELEVAPWRWAPAATPWRASHPHAVVYGPVMSRRLGRSLGIDLTPPGHRICSLECVYCDCGDLPRHGAGMRWPTTREVRVALEAAFQSDPALQSITFSGHGEPTLHPRFPEIVDEVLEALVWSGATVPVRILTNGTQVLRAPVREALDRLDERIVKLDAEAQRVDRPPKRHPFGSRVFALAMLRDITLQSCFVCGAVANVERESVVAWAGLVGQLSPRRVQIYTIDAQPAAGSILPVAATQLEEIACELRARTGIDAQVFA